MEAAWKLLPREVMEVRVLREEDVGFEVRWTWLQTLTPSVTSRESQGHNVTWSSLSCPCNERLRISAWEQSSEINRAVREAPSMWLVLP